jgi:hypothetical protein
MRIVIIQWLPTCPETDGCNCTIGSFHQLAFKIIRVGDIALKTGVI